MSYWTDLTHCRPSRYFLSVTFLWSSFKASQQQEGDRSLFSESTVSVSPYAPVVKHNAERAACNLCRISLGLMRRDGCSSESAPSPAGSIENTDSVPENGSVVVQTDQASDRIHYNSVIKKTHLKLALGVLEKLNMLIFVVFVCYMLWSIPANYGLFTTKSENSSKTEVLQVSGVLFLIFMLVILWRIRARFFF